MIKVGVFVGTRPEAIKMAPLVTVLREDMNFACTLVSTGQHKQMLEQTLAEFSLVPDISLDVMVAEQSLAGLSAKLYQEVDKLLESNAFDWILVQGDTTSVMVVATVAFYRRIRIGHVEAGLRSHNIRSPFPEEFNRKVLGMLADIHFCPTETAKENLLSEDVKEAAIHVTGNTGIDSIIGISKWLERNEIVLEEDLEIFLRKYPKYILVTGHRRENFGEGLKNICHALLHIARDYPQIGIIYPVHLNPNVKGTVKSLLCDVENIYLGEPEGYSRFVWLMKNCHFLLTDSGGIQEEAPAINKPVLVMRDNTERPEGVAAGCSIIVGTQTETIIQHVKNLLEKPSFYQEMAASENPYGDGKASVRIRNILNFDERGW